MLYFLVWSLECGVWSFGREDRFYLKNTFVPDRIIKVALLRSIIVYWM